MYASTTDMDQILGELPVSSGMDKQVFLDIAAAEMHTYMIGFYEVPVNIPSSVATATSGVSSNILKSINQDLASGRLILALDTTGENATLHSYGEWLVTSSIKKLEDIKTQVLFLPGAPLDSDRSDDKARVSRVQVSSPDDSSYFNRSYNEIANPAKEIKNGVDIT